MPLDKSALAKAKPSLVPKPETKPEPVAEKPKGSATSAFWLQEEDRAMFREANMLLLGAGIRPNDSLILRALLRLAHPFDTRLIEKCRELLEQDGRKTRHHKSPDKAI